MVETITITLNGREVSGYSGMTVLELARESGVDIPTLCHHQHLAPYGACRICLVEDEKSGALLASCVTPIGPGMVINTASPRVLERRSMIVRLMLASHPDSCVVCDKGNRCELRQIAADLGIGLAGLERVYSPAIIQEVNPFMERDLSKCILCAKCIRADHDMVVEGVIDYMDRGFGARPSTLADVALEQSECTFCGTCISVCPTGALMEKNRVYSGSTAKAVDTTCPFCGCGCTITLEIKDNRIVRAVPFNGRVPSNNGRSPFIGVAGHGPPEAGVASAHVPGREVNKGTICVRGSYGYEAVQSPGRLQRPLVRKDGDSAFEEASWEEALEAVAAGLNGAIGAGGPQSVAVLGSTKCTNEENYILQRFARTVLGTNNIDNGSRLSSAGTRVGLGWTLGTPGSTGCLEELEISDVIMVIGANPSESAPAVAYAIKRAVKQRGAKLLLVDPRMTKLRPFAHLWLRPRAGTDLSLVSGMARVIIAEGLQDDEFVTRRTDNYADYKASLAPFSPEDVEKATGVAGADLVEAARTFAGAERGSIVCGNGITQYVNGTATAMALANLAMLTGNIGPHGGDIVALQRDNNGQGAADMGALPGFLPGFNSVQDPEARSKFEAAWGMDIGENGTGGLPDWVGDTALEMIGKAQEGRLKAMYVVGENPALSFPGKEAVKAALASLDFLVVQDIFLTETAKLAHVVLPAAGPFEKEGTFTNLEGRVQYVRKAVDAPGESLPDSEIVMRLAARMGSPIVYTPTQIMNEIEDLVPLYEDPCETEIARPGGVGGGQFPGTDRRGRRFAVERSRRLHKGQFPSAFDRFHPVHAEDSPGSNPGPCQPDGGGGGLLLLAGTGLYRSGNGSTTSRSRRLKAIEPESYIELNESDMVALGISSGDMVKVISTNGEVAARARIAGTLEAGTVFMPISFPESPANALFGIELDSRSKLPALKACSVRLERIGS